MESGAGDVFSIHTPTGLVRDSFKLFNFQFPSIKIGEQICLIRFCVQIAKILDRVHFMETFSTSELQF